MATAARKPRARAGPLPGSVLAVVLVIGLAGHAAWWMMADPSPEPFLPEDAARDRAQVAALFPAAEPLTVRVLFVAEGGGNVLTAEALTAIAGLRSRLAADEQVAAALSPTDQIASPLVALAPHLDGRPGEWTPEGVRAALAKATNTEEGRRMLTTYLSSDARLRGAGTFASAMAVVVPLSPDAANADVAQEHIAALADATRAGGLAVLTDGPLLRLDALHHWSALWVPLLTLTLLVVVLLWLGAGPPAVLRAITFAIGAAGTALLVGVATGQASALAPSAAWLGTALGLGTAAPTRLRRAAPWLPVLVALPVVALAWASAGVGPLALVVATAALTIAWAAARWVRYPLRDPFLAMRARLPAPPWTARLPSLATPVLVGGLLCALVLGAGLADTAQGGWRDTLPTWTDGGRAAEAVETHFEGSGPGAGIVVSAWGPVTEPTFLEALAETTARLDQLRLAASGAAPRSILTLAEDWATDERRLDPADHYDDAFAARWANATQGTGVPQRDVPGTFAALRMLDPAAFEDLLVLDPGLPSGAGVALLRQQVTLGPAVPRPGPAITGALAPLVVASERVAVGGNALEDEQARAALLAQQGAWLVVSAGALLLASLVWTGREGLPLGVSGVVTGSALLAQLASAAIVAWAGIPLRPLVVLVPAISGAYALVLGVRLARAAARGQREGAPPRETVTEGLTGLIAGTMATTLPLVAVALAQATAPAQALSEAGLALLLALLVGAVVVKFVLPGLLIEAMAVSRPTSAPMAGPPRAHIACPVCQRMTATAAARCATCGQWNTTESCPAHQDALRGRCARCGGTLNEPHFA